MNTNKILLLGSNPFEVNVRHFSFVNHPQDTVAHSHTHNECEIYLNISGEVGFIAENNYYEIKNGDIFITRPHEYHHCIIRKKCVHEHFWITFSPNGNERFLMAFFARNLGEDNLFSLDENSRKKAAEICFMMLNNNDEMEQYILFFSLIKLIDSQKKQDNCAQLPKDIATYINYINRNFKKKITISELSNLTFVSVNTLERRFKSYIGITPNAYIQNRRFANAILLLKNGKSVTEAAYDSGFSDYSHFISLFKKRYGKTPLQFQKEML